MARLSTRNLISIDYENSNRIPLPMNDAITVDEVLQLYSKLGVPHFQRGLVWGDDSVSALLESLFFDTPCGSFVFWNLGDSQTHGVPLLNGTTDPIEHLVVDGQQRIRSLWQVFHGDQASVNEGEGDAVVEDDDRDGDRTWCINLTQLDQFKDILLPHNREYDLFVCTSWPKKESSNSPFKYNVLPLHLLRSGTLDELHPHIKTSDGKQNADLQGLIKDLREKVLAISGRRFFVTFKRGSPAEMISLYNRINSGGKRVEAEEIAFARLVALYPGSYHHIKKIFEAVHETEKRAVTPDRDHLKRDDVMARQKENRFGFKLFIRTFIQTSNYHLCRSAGSQSLSFNVVHGDEFARQITGVNSEKCEFLWNETCEVLVAARNLLRQELHYDSLAFLPDALSLVPIFQLLIQYPQLRAAQFQPLLGWAALALLLAFEDSEDILGLVAKLRDEGEIAADILPSFLENLDAEARSCILDPLTLMEADSIQNRYVLLLYGLVRRNRARDFSWKNVPGNKLMQDQESEIVCETCSPEKQHIVPFSCLKEAIGDGKAKRGSRHHFNNIGNLTYISSELNGLGTGLEQTPINRQYEPRENQIAHFMQDGENTDDIGPLYDEVKRLVWDEKETSSDDVESKYKRFCAARRALIAKGFESWLDDLKLRSLALMAKDKTKGEDVRMKAITPRCVERKYLPVTQQIRSMNYLNHIEDALVGYVRKYEDRHGLINPRNSTGTSFELCLSEGGALRLVISVDKIAAVYADWVPCELRAPVDSVLGISQTSPCLYEKKRGGSLTLAVLEEASLASEKLDAQKGQYLEREHRRTAANGRAPNLSEEELKELATKHKVLPLYEKVLNDLRPRFNSATRTRSSLTLCGRIAGGPEALIAVCPGFSSNERGLALVIYVDRVAQYFEIPEASLEEFLGAPSSDVNIWSMDQTWFFPAKRLDDFVRFLSKTGLKR